jgi:hypothetical protein
MFMPQCSLLRVIDACVVTEYVISPAGLLERPLWQAAGILGTTARGHVARRDQLEVTDQVPRLTFPVNELRPM